MRARPASPILQTLVAVALRSLRLIETLSSLRAQLFFLADGIFLCARENFFLPLMEYFSSLNLSAHK
jgi:hypothetical protein